MSCPFLPGLSREAVLSRNESIIAAGEVYGIDLSPFNDLLPQGGLSEEAVEVRERLLVVTGIDRPLMLPPDIVLPLLARCAQLSDSHSSDCLFQAYESHVCHDAEEDFMWMRKELGANVLDDPEWEHSYLSPPFELFSFDFSSPYVSRVGTVNRSF